MSTRESSPRSGRPKARVENGRVEMESVNTLRRLQARGERLLQWFPELRKTAEPGLEALLEQLQSLGGQVSRRAQETGRDLEARAERLLADLERQAARGLGPLLSRVNLASNDDIAGLERRLGQLEERFGSLFESRTALSSRLAEMHREHQEASAETGERFREVSVRLASTDEIRTDLSGVHEHLDALSREQVTRSLEIGKLHDRLIRLEMRMGDFLKEQGAQIVAQQEIDRRLAALDQVVAESTQGLQALRDRAANVATEGRATDVRLTAVISARNADHDELARLADLLAITQQALRQVDLRLGDLGERFTAVREELAGFAARVSNLELAPTRPVAPALLTERREGH